MLSELILNSESLNQVLDGKGTSPDTWYTIFQEAQKNPTELFKVSQKLRKKNKKKIVTFSKKAFFNLINLCKDSCSYCTYKAEPGEKKLSLMSKRSVSELLNMAKKYHCVEALFVTGERPEDRYSEARRWLKENGFSSTVEYITHCSEMALEKGLFPHTNAGNLSTDELIQLKKTNVSMGLMLENASDRLTKKDMPHYLAASKKPKTRLEVLENSGRLAIPMTTGLLIGIGETPKETIDSIVTIKNLHDKYQNIQEVILQNFQPKPDTAMSKYPSANENYFKIIVAITRLVMPHMNIQIPPNLSPVSYQSFLQTGINDWGGISPLTPDFVNPEFAWPQIDKVETRCKKAGFNLKCRFPVYPEYFTWVDEDLRNRLEEISDEQNYVREKYWR